MAPNVKRLRIWFATAGLLLIAVVAGFYGYARYRVHRAIEEVRKLPEKYGIDIQQTAKDFNLCKSNGPQTLFCVRAAKTVQFKGGNHAQLQDVNITIYGKHADRFDQIYGKTFDYDPQSGVVTAAGEVQIDLEGNANTAPHSDQAAPAEMKNPIHLKTSALTFNSKTGMAHTSERVEFRSPQASGSAIGADYDSKENRLTLVSQVMIHAGGQKSGDVNATHAVITKEPLLATLDNVRGTQPGAEFAADHLKMYFRLDSTVERVVASGNVHGRRDSAKAGTTTFRSGQAEVFVDEDNAAKNAVLSGGAVVDAAGDRPMHAEASRVLVDFGPKNQVKHVKGVENVKMVQGAAAKIAGGGARATQAGSKNAGESPASTRSGTAQTLELTSEAVDVDVRGGKTMEKAWTSGPAQIVTIQQQANAPPTRTTITAGRFDAAFNSKNQVKSLHGSPDAKMVSATQGQPDRVTTSRELDVEFNPNGNGIASMTQTGDFHYTEGSRTATAERAKYTTAEELFELSGNPRYSEVSVPPTQAQNRGLSGPPAGGAVQNSSAMSLSANQLKLNRRTGAINADGDVKTTYADLKPQAQGAMLGSSSAIHVTAEHMSALRSIPTQGQNRAQGGAPVPASTNPNTTARYSGNARLSQEANVVLAPTIDFDRDKRTMVAQGTPQDRVATVFVQQDKKGKATPVNVTAAQLTYNDTDRRARFTGGVVMKGQDATVTSERADVLLVARTTAPSATTQANSKAAGEGARATQPNSGPSQLQEITADGNVVITEPTRKATGQRLVYTAAEQKFVLTGGPPVITDAEKGRITGESLTFFSKDDRVLVEGSAAGPLKSSK